MGSHLIICADGKARWQSDKYPTCPAGKVPLSVEDPSAQPFLWAYAQVRRAVDQEFSDDLETALRAAGYTPPVLRMPDVFEPIVDGFPGEIRLWFNEHEHRFVPTSSLHDAETKLAAIDALRARLEKEEAAAHARFEQATYDTFQGGRALGERDTLRSIVIKLGSTA